MKQIKNHPWYFFANSALELKAMDVTDIVLQVYKMAGFNTKFHTKPYTLIVPFNKLIFICMKLLNIEHYFTSVKVILHNLIIVLL